MNCFEKHHIHNDAPEIAGELLLTFQARTRSRGRAQTSEGVEVCWFLDRGVYLGGGDYLKSETGEWVRIVPAPESLSCVTSNDPFLLLRAAYHLGNRHVPLAVTPDALLYQSDHVLDEMVKGLGLDVTSVDQPFHPEGGAYGGSAHSHSHHTHSPQTKDGHESGAHHHG